jgi:class 3 adenylate cyclase
MGTASTAPLAGRGRIQRPGVVPFVKRAFGPRIGGAPGSVERRAFWRFALVIPIANFLGAIDVFLFLWFILPLPEVASLTDVRLVNTIAFGVILVVTFVVCGSLANKCAEPIAGWLNSGEPADEPMVRKVLRFPLNQTVISMGAWAASALVFAVLDAQYSVTLGVLVGVAVLLGGVTTCGMMYLLAEKAFAPITAKALSSVAPRKPALPGVDARVLVTFGVTVAGPLLSMAAVAIAVLCQGQVTADRLALTMLVLAVGTLMSGMLAMKLVARSFALSLRSMRDALGRVERGNFHGEVPIFDGSEIGVLQAGFNSMVAGLREREELRDLFGRHVGADVARSALERGAELGGEQREAAVLFVDLIGSTALASERSPDDVLALLNRYFGLVVAVADRHNGWVNKFEGDGALCVFGAPHDMKDPAGCALSAARELDQRLRAELPELQAAIGVSAGTVVAGNVGSAERFEYTVIGDPVNEAARLTQLAKSTRERVRASEETLRRACAEERPLWGADGQVTLRGRSQPTQLVVPV